jgi:hypothetical protein
MSLRCARRHSVRGTVTTLVLIDRDPSARADEKRILSRRSQSMRVTTKRGSAALHCVERYEYILVECIGLVSGTLQKPTA